MHDSKPERAVGWRSVARWSAFSTVVLAAGVAAAPGCLDRPIEPVEPGLRAARALGLASGER